MDEYTEENHKKEFIRHVRDIAAKAFWDNIYNDIESGNFTKIIVLLDDLIKRITNLIPNNDKMQDEIKKELDIDLLKQQIENNAFEQDDFSNMFDCFCKWILYLESPAWDKSTRSFRNAIKEGIETEGYIKMIRYALDGINDILTITEYEIEEYHKKIKELEEQQKAECNKI